MAHRHGVSVSRGGRRRRPFWIKLCETHLGGKKWVLDKVPIEGGIRLRGPCHKNAECPVNIEHEVFSPSTVDIHIIGVRLICEAHHRWVHYTINNETSTKVKSRLEGTTK